MIQVVTGEKQSTFYLLQNIAMVIHCCNASCEIGNVPASEGLDEVFDFVEHSPESYNS